MNIQAQVLNESTGQPVTGGQVYAADQNGNPVAIARTNDLGNFTADVPDSSPSILVAAPGYSAKSIDTGDVNDGDSVITMKPQALAAGAQTSQITNTTISALPWWVWVGGAGILLYAVSDKKKSAAVGKTSDFIIPIALVVGGYLILKNLGLLGGSSAADQNTSATSQANTDAINSSLASAQAAGDFATISAAQASGMANGIFNAGTSSPVDQDSIETILIEANTLTDLLMISQAFGTKNAGGAACSLFGGVMSSVCTQYTLNSFVKATLDAQHLQSVNSYLTNQGINYQF